MEKNSSDPDDNWTGSRDDLELARNAAQGDKSSRLIVSKLADSLIQQKTKTFCRRFCHDNYIHNKCTLLPDRVIQGREAPLCEWGNHSYAWMLEDLTSPKRLLAFTGENGSRLSTYLYAIANSLPFYERWKDWRFGRRIRVPEYIQDIAPLAGRIFFGLRSGDSLDLIAQHSGEPIEKIEIIAERIIAELTSRGKLYLLEDTRTLSMTGLNQQEDEHGEDIEGDIPDYSWDPGEDQVRNLISEGWDKLNPNEQFVLESLIIDERDANDIIKAITLLGITIKDGVPPDKTDRQQLYYYKRKALAKLARLSGISTE